MKSNFNVSAYKMNKYIYLSALVISLVMAAYLFHFIKKNVYSIYVLDQGTMGVRRNSSSGEIDMKKFDKIIERLNDKKQRNNIKKSNDILDDGENNDNAAGRSSEEEFYF